MIATSNFASQLAFGQIAESAIVKWILRRGSSVLPAYDLKCHDNKGPRLLAPSGGIVSPDLLVFAPDKSLSWVEAKHKTAFSWHRITRRWVTGIDYHHFKQYREVKQQTGIPVWILFLHRQGTPDARDMQYDCPVSCPTGLFGGEVDDLAASANHTSPNHGRSGMIYWSHHRLALLASLSEIEPETPRSVEF